MKKRPGFKDSKVFSVITQMPALRHSLPDRKFDIQKSPVAQWLCSQPEILNYLFAKAQHSGAITFDPESQMWIGIKSTESWNAPQ